MIKAHYHILPSYQRELWNKLHNIPKDFVLYGGTALALHLGHRRSVDFDFFSHTGFKAETLQGKLDFLKGMEATQFMNNTLTFLANKNCSVSFFGNLPLKQCNHPQKLDGVAVASILDIFGSKVGVIQQRTDIKDFVDIYTILKHTNYTLADGFGACRAIYGEKRFFPEMSKYALVNEDSYNSTGFNNLKKDLYIEVDFDEIKSFLQEKGKGVNKMNNIASLGYIHRDNES